MKTIIVLIPLLLAASPVAAQEIERSRGWTIGIAGGTTAIDGNDDQPFASMSVERNFGPGYVGLAATQVWGDEEQGALGSISARTRELRLLAGTSVGSISVDAYVGYGWRRFDDAEFRRRTGQTVIITSKGDVASAGLSLSYATELRHALSLAPWTAVDYGRVDTVRVAASPAGLVSRKDTAKGVTGTLGLSLDRRFGQDRQHVLGVHGAVSASSNAASFRRTSSFTAIRAGGDAASDEDRWAEFGASGSFAVSQAVRVEAALVRTAGFAGGDSTFLSTGLTFAF